MKVLNESNLELYAAQHYYNPKYIDAEEFQEDLKRFKYVKRLLNKYYESGKIAERLILNHLVVLFNVFGFEAGLNILQIKINDQHWSAIKPFLIFLRAIEQNDARFEHIKMDPVVVEKLRKI